MTRRRWARTVIRLVLSAAVLAVVLSLVDLEKAREGLSRLSPFAWVGALAGFLLLHGVIELLWRYMLGVAGVGLARGLAVRCHAAGLFGNLSLPSLIGGDLLRAGLALPASRSPGALVLGSALDRLADLTALVLLVLIGFLAAPEARDAVSGALGSLPMVAGLVVLAIVAVAVPVAVLARPRLLRRLPRKAARLAIQFIRAGRTVLSRPGRATLGLLFCVAIQAGFVLVNLRVGTAMGLELSPGLWFLLWPLAKVAAMLPVSFGGIGVREAAFAGLVAPFGQEALAVAQSLVWESVLIAGGLLAGGFWLITSAKGAGGKE